MKYENYKRILAKQKAYENMLLKNYPNLQNSSGIYALTRFENGIKYAYVGQAKHILNRLVGHLTGYSQHIDISLKKHGLFSLENSAGYKIEVYDAPVEDLDKAEQFYIKYYSDSGYQLRNHTIGGQNEGKFGMENNKPAKTYRDGVVQGMENARKYVEEIFDKYLKFDFQETAKNKDGSISLIYRRKYDEFKDWLKK